jgi:para-nitrobenzyl esterase
MMNARGKFLFRFGLIAVFTCIVLLLLAPSFVGAWHNKLMVNTQYGKLKGFLSEDRSTMIWKGIPYAKPPVGDLRWKAPQEPKPWDGVRDATKPAKKCTQLYTTIDWIRTGEIDSECSEDCLYLDIYRPNRSGRLPVYVWIHGGSNNFGSAREYDGAKLAVESDIVVVVIQYRLGPLGWFYHPALQTGDDPLSDSGNFGTLDHVQALKWVRENIHAFGGDPHNVTVAGESAGAHNTMNLVISPLGKGLFHRAVYQSGGMAPVTADYGRAAANGYIERLIRYKENVDALTAENRRKEMENNGSLETYLRETAAGDFFLALVKTGSVPTFPVIMDGYVMPFGGWIPAIQSGNYNKMPIILGSNEYELKAFMPLYGSVVKLYGAPSTLPKYSWSDLFTSIRYNNNPKFEDILKTPFDWELYDKTGYFGSLQWKAKNVDSIARELAKVQDKVYTYLFKWGGIGSGPYPFDHIYGASHAAEISFFFGWNKGLFDIPDLTGPGARDLQNAMMAYLSNFTRTGNPNSGDPHHKLPHKRTKWLQWSNAPREPKSIVFDADFYCAKINMMNEEVTFASAEAERQSWVSAQDSSNQWLADNVTKLFLWQPPW